MKVDERRGLWQPLDEVGICGYTIHTSRQLIAVYYGSTPPIKMCMTCLKRYASSLRGYIPELPWAPEVYRLLTRFDKGEVLQLSPIEIKEMLQ